MKADFEKLYIPTVEAWGQYLLMLANNTDDTPVQYYAFRKAAEAQYKYHYERLNQRGQK